MPQIIPYDFDPPASDYEEAHLEYERDEKGTYVRWPLIGIQIYVPIREFYHSLREIEVSNGSTFTLHNLCGFTIGRYHEFLTTQVDGTSLGFDMGGIEATFGRATPLMAFLFEPCRSKHFGDWDSIATLRLYGVDRDQMEAAIINSCCLYHTKTGFLPRIWSMDEDILFDEEVERTSGFAMAPPIKTDIDPLRFIYHGMNRSDDAASCIYFYRVIEYFSFLQNTKAVTILRHDGSISDADFNKRIIDLLTRDEKGPIISFIASIAEKPIIDLARTEKLIDTNSGPALAESAYRFRNSIVHGKLSYGFTLLSGSVIDTDVVVAKWRSILFHLAQRALERYGSTRR